MSASPWITLPLCCGVLQLWLTWKRSGLSRAALCRCFINMRRVEVRCVHSDLLRLFLNRLPTQHVLHIRDLRLTQRSTSVINTLPRLFIHLRKHFILISERPLQLQIHASCLSFKSFFVLDLHFPVCVTTKTEALYSHKCLQLINKSSLYGSFCGGTLVSQSADAGCVQQRNQTQTKHGT